MTDFSNKIEEQNEITLEDTEKYPKEMVKCESCQYVFAKPSYLKKHKRNGCKLVKRGRPLGKVDRG